MTISFTPFEPEKVVLTDDLKNIVVKAKRSTLHEVRITLAQAREKISQAENHRTVNFVNTLTRSRLGQGLTKSPSRPIMAVVGEGDVVIVVQPSVSPQDTEFTMIQYLPHWI